ncbi:hypothetical protein LGM42_24010 [Burkholderia sp. AU39826]|uniref:hypothetical protein n=1 Tax=Burkholderia sp. AU39826 TaxID=2879634 RepID=UPI001CF31362|nr:hypothetical protein [Burkholderia sp. AU39826]MCA7972934.1 hypothetical protein [Burkholderia sp. AU39826]
MAYLEKFHINPGLFREILNPEEFRRNIPHQPIQFYRTNKFTFSFNVHHQMSLFYKKTINGRPNSKERNKTFAITKTKMTIFSHFGSLDIDPKNNSTRLRRNSS